MFNNADRTTAIGQSINAYLKGQSQVDDHVIHLLFSANRWEAAQGMLADIESGTTLIVDRYSYSGAVYSAAKDNPILDLEWAWLPEIGLPKPDVCVFLTVSPEVAKARGGFGEERYESDKMQGRVRELFEVLLQWAGEDNVLRVNADKELDAVESSIVAGIHEYLTLERLSNPIGKLKALKPTTGT